MVIVTLRLYYADYLSFPDHVKELLPYRNEPSWIIEISGIYQNPEKDWAFFNMFETQVAPIRCSATGCYYATARTETGLCRAITLMPVPTAVEYLNKLNRLQFKVVGSTGNIDTNNGVKEAVIWTLQD